MTYLNPGPFHSGHHEPLYTPERDNGDIPPALARVYGGQPLTYGNDIQAWVEQGRRAAEARAAGRWTRIFAVPRPVLRLIKKVRFLRH